MSSPHPFPNFPPTTKFAMDRAFSEASSRRRRNIRQNILLPPSTFADLPEDVVYEIMKKLAKDSYLDLGIVQSHVENSLSTSAIALQESPTENAIILILKTLKAQRL